jgi:hypothetical protein
VEKKGINKVEKPRIEPGLHLFLLVFIFSWRIVYSLVYRIYFDPVPAWLGLIGELVMYTGIAILIFLERDRLQDYFLDHKSLGLIVIFGMMLRTPISKFSWGTWALNFICWVPAIIVVIALMKRENTETEKNSVSWLSFMVWAAIGFSVAFLLNYFPSLIINGKLEIKNNIVVILYTFVHEMTHASLYEEPLFRGFLPIYLIKHGWSEKYAWIFQGVLFWLAHIYYLPDFYTFWIAVPIITIILSFLAWKNKSILPGIAAHAAYNAVRFVF